MRYYPVTNTIEFKASELEFVLLSIEYRKACAALFARWDRAFAPYRRKR